jgi:RHH-type proline utilization regulon transcriptional repressor/proline dehydrogenase/delta 1-pyrroline-5-carboxylate dehydrogenase
MYPFVDREVHFMSPATSGLSRAQIDLAQQSIDTVHRWLRESAVPDESEAKNSSGSSTKMRAKSSKSAERLAGVLKDPRGLDFTIGFVDRVVRPEDLKVAGHNLEKLSHAIPRFLPWYMRAAIVFGGAFAPVLPWLVVPIARRVLRTMVGHLIIDATPKQLDKSLATLRETGARLNLNLLGEAVLGDAEADRRLTGTRALLERDDVDYVSIKVSSVSSQLSMWSFDETVERVVERLTPLYEIAALSTTKKFINLDMEEFRDLDLTIAVFTEVLDQPRLRQLEAGIVLQAYLPDALSAMQGLTEWAQERRAEGGAGIKVRLVKGANLAMEQVDARIHGWPLATWGSKQQTDTNYKRVLDWSLTPERTAAVRVGIAGHNLFDVAHAWLLAKQRKVESRIEFEMLLGMATEQADAVKRDVGGLLLYTPVVQPREFDSAISYLIRRLEENASSENFMSGVFELGDKKIFDREANRFLASLQGLYGADAETPHSHRVQDRNIPALPTSLDDSPHVFSNEPDTDPAIAENREWGRRILSRVNESHLGLDTILSARVTDPSILSHIIETAVQAGQSWGQRRAETRATVLHSAGEALAAARANLIEVMASETGKTIAEGDVEVSEAVDFAHYYAESARELDRIVDARFVPSKLIVVTPPWNFPVAIPAGSVLAALASGAAVIIKPAPQAKRSAAVMVEALWAGGVPRDVLRLVDIEEGDLGKQLISHPAVGRVILTGAFETAQLFRSWRPNLPLLAETSGKNAIIVTPSADLDLAVADIVRSAFGHAGQKCSAASLVILVGSVAKSERFKRQLVDSVTTLRVGYPSEPTTIMGPIIEPAHGKLRHALTALGAGERWLVQPRQVDASGRLWSPGVRDNVAPESEFHLTEYFGPVLGIMTAETLEEAIDLQNAPAYGLTAGIHSLDAHEIELWLERVEAGNLYVNRGITGAVVRRQPFGGWKRSTVGASAKAGGPNYLLTLGDWQPVFEEPGQTVTLHGLSPKVTALIQAAQPSMDFLEFDRVRSAALSDQLAWDAEFGIARDVSGLGIERNVFRYLPVPVTIRLAEGASPAQLVRVVAAATRAGAALSISSAVPVAAGLMRAFASTTAPVEVVSVVIESDSRWHDRLVSEKADSAQEVLTPAESLGLVKTRPSAARPGRIRLIGGDALKLAETLGGDPDVAIYAGPVTTAGRIEILPFVHEQAVSITAHRFGNPDLSAAAIHV